MSHRTGRLKTQPLPAYAELRCKSNFSFLLGASHPEELVKTAIAHGLSGLALTDQNGVYGMPRGYHTAISQLAAATRERPEFHYIVGAEILFADHAPVHLLCQTRESYGVLCRLLTQLKSDKQKALGRIAFADFLNFMSSPANPSSEFICLPRIELTSLQLGLLKDVFAANMALPLTFYLDGHDANRVRTIRDLSRRFELPLVASNDVEYHVKSRKILQDVLISIREGKPLSQAGFALRANAERYILTPHEMARRYRDFQPALTKTLELAESCTFSPSELRYRYPSEWIPSGFSAQTYLEHLVWTHVTDRYPSGMSDKVKKQLEHELKLIGALRYADYFLTIYDIVEFAKRREILCQGRGSAANSAVCYVLGITAIDPVQMDLLFERFISAERGEPPDIDIDFEHERREEVIQYIYEKYGRHRAAMVSAVITYQYRNALREVCKAFGLPVGTLSAKKVERNFETLIKTRPVELRACTHPRAQIEAIARELHGFPRHLSIHSGGFTLSADPITEIVPVEPARMEGRTIIQWDKYDLDTLGLIKVDILSLGMLSCLRKTLQLVNLKLYEIPRDDNATFEMIGNCDTVGVFQIESRAQMSMLGRLQPKNFYDLVIEVAIVRPGPIVGKMVHPYLRRRQGLESITYPNAIVERILGRTLGIPLFQEQIMKLAIELAGFTPGESDQLRKCINAWRTSASIGQLAGRLMDGLRNAGLSREFAEQIFEHIKGFSHYGFPESHAASFALLAYASCYLKCHFPAEFACSAVNSQPMGFYRPDTILYDAIRHGVRVLPVSILHSQWDCTVENKSENARNYKDPPAAIRLGFRLVHGISRSDVEALIAERENLQFQNLADFVHRSNIKRDILERLALAGRFAELSHRTTDNNFSEEARYNPREALWALLEYQNLFRERRKGTEWQQLNLFAESAANLPANLPLTEIKQTDIKPDQFSPLSPLEHIQNEYSAFAMSLHGHPMSELRRRVKNVPKVTSQTVRTLATGTRVKVSGMTLVRQRPPTANGVCFATIEDEHGFMDLVLWKDIFEKYREVFLNHCFITVTATVQHEGATVSLIVSKVEPIFVGKPQDRPSEPATLLKNADPTQYFYG